MRGVAITIAIAAALALYAGWFGQKAAADGLILYGGVGHVKGAWQPRTQEILTARSGGLARMRRDLGVALENHARAKRFGWSDLPVAVTSEDVVEAIRTRDPAWNQPLPTVSDILSYFESVYALVTVPTYEAGFVAGGGSSAIAVDKWVYSVWTSAVLVELGTGEVKLAATAAHEDNIRVDGGVSLADGASTRIKDLIALSGRAAIDRLAQLSARREPADDFPMMFTGTIVTDPLARSLFRYGKVEKAGRKNVCAMPSECRNEACGRLIALVANALADSLTQRGTPILPPINLNAWGERAEDRVALNLSLPRGADHFEEELSIAVGAESADKKIVPVVSHLKFVDGESSARLVKQREYVAAARVYSFETEPNDCTKLIGQAVTAPSVSEERTKVVRDAPDHAELQQARLLGLLNDALSRVDYDALD